MRLFVALEVPSQVRSAVAQATADARRQYPRLRWVDGDGLHLTLAFLGNVDTPPARVAEVVAHPAAASAPIGLRLTAAGRFDARVLWLGVDDDPAGAVAALGADVQARLAEAGLPVDRKRVRAHLTIARARERRGVGAGVVATVAPVTGEWRASEVVVLASHPGGRGVPNRYEAMASLALGS